MGFPIRSGMTSCPVPRVIAGVTGNLENKENASHKGLTFCHIIWSI